MNRYEEQDAKLYQAVYSLMCGNADSYYDMYNLSIKYIYKIIYDIVKDYHTTEDLVQETYIAIYNNLGNLQDITKFYAWAGRIATNFTLRYIQSNKRELLTLDGEEEASDFIFDVAAQDNEAFIPENILMDREKQRILADIIDGLAVEQKIVVQYFYYEEMSVSEIAGIMECPVGTVKSRLNYARKTIKNAVLDLEVNENTRLYSLSHIPLFLLVFREAVENFSFGGAVGVAAIGAEVVGAKATIDAAFAGEIAGQGAATVGGGAVSEGAVAIGGGTAVEGAGAIGGSAATAGTVNTGAVGSATATGVSGTTATGGAMAGKATTGALAKVFGTVGGKIAVGVVTTGVLVTGGVAIHNAVTEDNTPETSPMVIHMESTPNTYTLEDEQDLFTYEFLTVTYEDKKVSIGFDEEIYKYGYDSYQALSPELEELHQEKYEAIMSAPDEEREEIIGDIVEFTIDGEKFVFHLEDVEVLPVNDSENYICITLRGECETPKNVESLYEKYRTIYEEKLVALEEAAAQAEAEHQAKEELIKAYYVEVVKDFYLYGTDPFGTYHGDYKNSEYEKHDYAIHDVDGDGWSDLIVRYGYSAYIYGYNPDTYEVILKMKYDSVAHISIDDYKFYESGLIVHWIGDETPNEVTVYRYNSDEQYFKPTWGVDSLEWHLYLPSLEGASDPALQAEEQEILSQYDIDGDGNVWVYSNGDGIYEYYDNVVFQEEFAKATFYGKEITLEYMDISTVITPEDYYDIIRSYYSDIVQNFYMYGTDPFGGSYDYFESDYTRYDYAICDVDCDGWEELIVRYNYVAYIYGYNPITGELVQEHTWANVAFVNLDDYKFYDNGYIVLWHGYDKPSYVDVFVHNKDTDMYDDSRGFTIEGFNDVPNESIIAQYDLDGDGMVWNTYKDGNPLHYDYDEFIQDYNTLIENGNEITMEFVPLSTPVTEY